MLVGGVMVLLCCVRPSHSGPSAPRLGPRSARQPAPLGAAGAPLQLRDLHRRLRCRDAGGELHRRGGGGPAAAGHRAPQPGGVLGTGQGGALRVGGGAEALDLPYTCPLP